MKLSGPYLTLAGGLAVAGTLIALNTNAGHDADRSAAALASLPAQKAAATQAPAPAKSTPAKVAPKPKPEPKVVIKPVPDGTYAGSVKGGDASVAITVKDGTAIAYACDGTKVEAWMQGGSKTSSLSLKGKQKASLKADYAGKHLSGTLTAGKKKWDFRVKAVKAPSGLYRASRNVRKATVIGGWIVVNGKQVGLLSSSTGERTPAPAIDLATGDVVIDGTTVHATAVTG